MMCLPRRVGPACSADPVFFFHATATTEIYTLSLHDALPISPRIRSPAIRASRCGGRGCSACGATTRSGEHTSELQSRLHRVCRLLLEKKKQGRWVAAWEGGEGVMCAVWGWGG